MYEPPQQASPRPSFFPSVPPFFHHVARAWFIAILHSDWSNARPAECHNAGIDRNQVYSSIAPRASTASHVHNMTLRRSAGSSDATLVLALYCEPALTPLQYSSYYTCITTRIIITQLASRYCLLRWTVRTYAYRVYIPTRAHYVQKCICYRLNS